MAKSGAGTRLVRTSSVGPISQARHVMHLLGCPIIRKGAVPVLIHPRGLRMLPQHRPQRRRNFNAKLIMYEKKNGRSNISTTKFHERTNMEKKN